MVSIKGRYEYDDDDLTPGKKKGGGLHQNLYDRDGNLKANARFIPDVEQDDSPDPVVIYQPANVRDMEYERRRARDQEMIAELINDVVKILIAEATPHAKRLWTEKARPAIEARRAEAMHDAKLLWKEKARPVIEARRARKVARKTRKAAAKQPIVVEATVVDTGQELAVAEEVYRTDMSSAEAQARYLAALAARAFSEEQIKLVSDANIVDGESLAELQRTLAELPPQQVRDLIETVEANPSVLSGDLLAELGKLLGLDRVEPEAIRIEERRDR
ncbi:hypothetical protein [Prescottella equi]|uniref:hypothetical protein n=1 Tax=Rhodococcus hoagii TaxID=43767 RepID=UPI0023DC30E6|nr:hypothetical protein [Prescottella equi]